MRSESPKSPRSRRSIGSEPPRRHTRALSSQEGDKKTAGDQDGAMEGAATNQSHDSSEQHDRGDDGRHNLYRDG